MHEDEFNNVLVKSSVSFLLSLSLTGLAYKPPSYKEKDMNSSPKFITPLVDRCVIAGYNAAISCAVRGSPKVSVGCA